MPSLHGAEELAGALGLVEAVLLLNVQDGDRDAGGIDERQGLPLAHAIDHATTRVVAGGQRRRQGPGRAVGQPPAVEDRHVVAAPRIPLERAQDPGRYHLDRHHLVERQGQLRKTGREVLRLVPQGTREHAIDQLPAHRGRPGPGLRQTTLLLLHDSSPLLNMKKPFPVSRKGFGISSDDPPLPTYLPETTRPPLRQQRHGSGAMERGRTGGFSMGTFRLLIGSPNYTARDLSCQRVSTRQRSSWKSAGSSVIRPSPPSASRRRMSRRSLTVQKTTTRPSRRESRMRRGPARRTCGWTENSLTRRCTARRPRSERETRNPSRMRSMAARACRRARGEKEETTRRSLNLVRATARATAHATASGAAGAPRAVLLRAGGSLISMFMPQRPRAYSRDSSRVGIRSPRKRDENHAHASRRRRSFNVIAATSPRPLVVRSTVPSWITTGTPSAVRWTSSSMALAPRRTASAKAASVFSGARAEAPRWAMRSGRRSGAAAGAAGAVRADGRAEPIRRPRLRSRPCRRASGRAR